jgi:hypothetical protein
MTDANEREPEHRSVLHPRSECDLVCAVAALRARGIQPIVRNARFGALYPGPVIPLYNERAVLVPVEQESAALLVLAGDERRRRLFRPRRSLLDRLRVVLELALFGWFVPGSSARLRPFRALALAFWTSLLLVLLLLILAASATYLTHRFEVLNSKSKIGAMEP